MRVLLMCIVLLAWNVSAQTPISVYDCSVNPAVTQAQIDADDDFRASCVLFEAPGPYSFDQNDNKTVTASKQIDVEPGFDSDNFAAGNGMTLVLCDDLKDAVCFSHTNLNNVEALKKFEFGIELPMNIEQRIQDYIATGDSTDPVAGGINPYLDWQFNAEAVFTHRASGFTKTRYGFYFQEFERDTNYVNHNDWWWNSLTTTHHTRFRYAPEQTGIWDIGITVTLKDGSVFTYCPFSINVTSNTEDDGYVKVAANKRVLERNDEFFFPIGQNAPWPRESGDGIGSWAGTYGDTIANSRAHVEFEKRMEQYQEQGLEYFRLILNPACLDIEFEEVGNYTDRLNLGWEIDQIIEKAEELDLYINFNMMVHYAFDSKSEGVRYNWDWGDEYIQYKYPNSEGSYAYKNRFGIHDTLPELWLSNEGCKKYYKQKIRYLISRYGYSPHIALFELLSESSNVGIHWEDTYPDTTGVPQMNKIREPYQDDPLHPARLAAWHVEMAKYIKNDLKHTEHLLTASYGPNPKPSDYTFSADEIEVMTYNRYSTLIGEKYQAFIQEIKDYQALYDKPILLSETGPTSESACDNGITYKKEAWTNAFTGVAGFNMWDGQNSPELWPRLKTVRDFIEDTPEIANLLTAAWTSFYINDFNALLPAEQKEATYLRGAYVNELGNLQQVYVGCISNLTDNYYTNTDLQDSTWCTEDQNTPIIVQQAKVNLNWGDLIIGSPTQVSLIFEWYDQEATYLYSNIGLPVPFPYLIHPTSCVTGNCQYNTSNIPFVARYEYLNFEKSADTLNRKLLLDEQEKNDPTTEFNLQTFPNPARSVISIACNDPMVSHFELRDGNGSLIRTLSSIHNQGLQISISNLEPGIFVILGMDATNTIKYQKRWVKL